MKGKLITFEGIDGSGKSTQIKLLEAEFRKRKIAFRTFREPGGTRLSEKIRDILLDKSNIELLSNAESLLFAAARSQLISEQIIPSINRAEIVICDRFSDSTLAYQGYGRGMDVEKLKLINKIATNDLTPDITFILDIDPLIASTRRNIKKMDRMESSGIDFFIKIHSGYHKIAEDNKCRCIIIDGEESKENIFKKINKTVMKRFKEELI